MDVTHKRIQQGASFPWEIEWAFETPFLERVLEEQKLIWPTDRSHQSIPVSTIEYGLLRHVALVIFSSSRASNAEVFWSEMFVGFWPMQCQCVFSACEALALSRTQLRPASE